MEPQILRCEPAAACEADRADEQERKVRCDIPEVRDAEKRALVREIVIRRILRNRSDEEHAAYRGRHHESDQQIFVEWLHEEITRDRILLPSLAAAEPSFDQPTLRFFEQADGPILPVTRRVYTTRFDATRARRLGVEVSARYHRGTLACTMKKPDGSVIPATADGIPVLRRQDR